MQQTELDKLIERARKIEMTPEDKFEQMVSFAYGNLAIENAEITRDLIRQEAKKLIESGRITL